MRIVDRGATVAIIGGEEETGLASTVLNGMLDAVRGGHIPSLADVDNALEEARAGEARRLGSLLARRPEAIREDVHIRPRTRGQHRYLDAIHSHEITLVAGPAGTGKTFLAMAAAVSALLNKQVKRLVLTRPAVEAGERLGFLPGDLAEKVNPYLRPLYDALHDMMEFDKAQAMIQRGQIEVAPLAFMRGRTLNDSFVILDEAQNSTSDQMRMFLTRLGHSSKAVVTGDVTQVDLPNGQCSGLAEARVLLRGVEGIAFCEFTEVDVVRHPLVQKIIRAYESRDAERASRRDDPPASGSEPPPSSSGRT